MSDHPKVSVCIPSYNHARFLPATLDSILAQTYKDFEVVIFDDGSSDGSLGIAQKYAAKHPELIRVLTHPGHENRGIAATVNRAFENIKGKYWMGLPSDDMMYPDKLKLQVEFLDQHPDVGWVYSYADCIDADGQPLQSRLFGEDLTHAAEPLESLIERNVVPGMTVLMRRETSQSVGLHDGSLVYNDWEYWIRMLVQSRVAFIDRPLIKYRIHTYNVSVGIDLKNNMRRAVEVLQSLKRKSASIGKGLQRPRIQALLDLQLTYHFFCLSETKNAEQTLESAFRADTTLQKDARFFSEWLKRKMLEIMDNFPRDSRERAFASWLLPQLASTAGKRLTRQVAAVRFGIAALDNYQGDRRQTRRLALSCVAHDPRWLTDKSLCSVLFESLVGAGITGRLRALKASLSNSRNDK
jgi:glycosyltransferase involved in cell wall biosynthesis